MFLLTGLALSTPAYPQTEPEAAPPYNAAMRAIANEDWDGAMALAQPAGLVAVDMVEWQRLRASKGTFEDALSFLKRRADWPGLPLLRKRSEVAITPQTPASQVIDFFGDALPQTLYGSYHYARALKAMGRNDLARSELRRSWATYTGDSATEQAILQDFAPEISDMHGLRADALLWDGDGVSAVRLLPRLTPQQAHVVRARLAYQTDADGLDVLLRLVPSDLLGQGGLAYDRFKWLLRQGRREAAIDLMLSQSKTDLGRAEYWAEGRQRFARDFLDNGNPQRAYELAAHHGLTTGADFAALEWLAGFIALRKLDKPQAAYLHFTRHESAVATPISLARSHYWQGRALEAAGDTVGAQVAFEAGAKYQTSFYGLLASEKAGLPLDPRLTGKERAPTYQGIPYLDSSVYEAAKIWDDAGYSRQAIRFLTHLAERLDRGQLMNLTEHYEIAGRPEFQLLLAKRGARYGNVIERAYYPLHPLVRQVEGIPTEMALAIARRESEFFPDARSGVGALGLMQVMPATGEEMAGKLGLPWDQTQMTRDPVYNAKIGVGYLGQLYAQFGNSPVQIAAAYNAGPSRPLRWMRERGDPRLGEVDVIDWIETIPFGETRNYVMRVTESLPLYRARLTGEVGHVAFSKMLIGEYVAPPPPLAPVSSMRPVVRPTDLRPSLPPNSPETLEPAAPAAPSVLRPVARPVGGVPATE